MYNNFEKRWYQEEAVNALIEDVKTHNPVIALPTGTGKTVVISDFIYKFSEQYPKAKFLIVSNTQEILKQDYETIQKFFPDQKIGLYSNGLKSKTIENITVAGIQSIYRKPEKFDRFHIIIIDEAHCVPPGKKSMYRRFINALSTDKRYIGLSATIFRRGTGYIHEGENRLFNKLSYDLSSYNNFNQLIDENYLSPLIGKGTDFEMDLEGVRTVAQDYNLKDLSLKCDRKEITEKSVAEAVRIGRKNYKSWLVFCIDTEHANHVNNEFIKQGYNSKVLHSKMNGDRKQIIDEFKNRSIQILTSVGMVTTGFDAANIDLIVLLRPTKSPVLHVQMLGRGTRIYEGKKHCLVLDFVGNIKRLGAINNVLIPDPKNKKQKGLKPPIKQCPQCGCFEHIKTKLCSICGYIFEFKEKIKELPDQVDVIYKPKTDHQWLKVDDVFYNIHHKKDKPNSLKVTYRCGLTQVHEYVCLDHLGYARHIALYWVKKRWIEKSPSPNTIDQLFKYRDKLEQPDQILVDIASKYFTIKDIKF